jgi:hypothetical protein
MGGGGHVELLLGLAKIWGRVKNGREMQEGRTLRVRPSRKLAEFSASAASSDMAQPIIVAGATTHGLAQMGPGIDHGAGPYS